MKFVLRVSPEGSYTLLHLCFAQSRIGTIIELVVSWGEQKIHLPDYDSPVPRWVDLLHNLVLSCCLKRDHYKICVLKTVDHPPAPESVSHASSKTQVLDQHCHSECSELV